jgi:hypothetical protein
LEPDLARVDEPKQGAVVDDGAKRVEPEAGRVVPLPPLGVGEAVSAFEGDPPIAKRKRGASEAVVTGHFDEVLVESRARPSV